MLTLHKINAGVVLICTVIPFSNVISAGQDTAFNPALILCFYVRSNKNMLHIIVFQTFQKIFYTFFDKSVI